MMDLGCAPSFSSLLVAGEFPRGITQTSLRGQLHFLTPSSDLLLILVPTGTLGSEPIPSCYDCAWPADVMAIPSKPHNRGLQLA